MNTRVEEPQSLSVSNRVASNEGADETLRRVLQRTATHVAEPNRQRSIDVNSRQGVSAPPDWDQLIKPLPVPQKYGETGSWEEYDKAADKHDQDMVVGLNDNVDVLLIFAGLFSGVNTAFIVLSLALLSPGPADETNTLLRLLVQRADNSTLTVEDLVPPTFVSPPPAVRINCSFAASLTCSLMAAFGATIGKQWVGHYARTGQLGPLNLQGRRRQRKFNGVRAYRFRLVVESLPNLLQIALLLFFVGLIDFLWLLNSTVAKVVLGIALLGFMLYVLSVITASRDPFCPFQTPFSTLIRRATLSARYRLAHLARRTVPKKAAQPPSRVPDQADRYCLTSNSYQPHEEYKDGDDVDAAAACWILETSSRKEAVLDAARNLPALLAIESNEVILDTLAYQRLQLLFRDSLKRLIASMKYHGPSKAVERENIEAAIVYGRAISHTLIGRSPRSERHNRQAFTSEIDQDRSVSDFDVLHHAAFYYSELRLLHRCLISGKYWSLSLDGLESSALPLYIATVPVVTSGEERPLGIVELALYALSAPSTDRVVGLVAWSLSTMHLNDWTECCAKEVEDMWTRRWDAYTSDANMFENVLEAFKTYPLYARTIKDGVCDKEYNRTYVALLKAIQPDQTYDRGAERYTNQERLNLNSQFLRALEGILSAITFQIRALLRHALVTSTEELLRLPTPIFIELGGERLEPLRHLQREVLMSIQQILDHRVGLLPPEALPFWQTMDTGVENAEVLEQILSIMARTHTSQDRYLNLFKDYPTVAPLLVGALKHDTELVRDQALSLIWEKATVWFNHGVAEAHQQFIDAGLALALAAHIDESSRVNRTLRVLTKRPEWRKQLVTDGLLDTSYESVISLARKIQGVNQRDRMRQCGQRLDLWYACYTYSDFDIPLRRWMSNEMVSAITDCVQTFLEGKDLTLDGNWIPPSLVGYVCRVNKAHPLVGRDADVRHRFGEVFEELDAIGISPSFAVL